MNLPITSRIKRSPLLETKDPKDPKATGGGTIEGKDEIIEENVMGEKTDFVSPEDEREKDPKKWEEKRKGICQGTIKGDKSKVDCSDVVVDKKKTTVKGDDVDYDVDLMTTKKEGTMLAPFEVRQQLRGGTRADRQVNKTRRKMEKYGTFNDANGDGIIDAGEFTENPNLSARQKRKLDQARRGNERAQAMSENITKGVKSGARRNQSYYQGQRQLDQGEQDPKVQAAEAERKKKKALREEMAASSQMTTGQSTNAIDPNQSVFKGAMDSAKNLDLSLNYQVGKYTSPLGKKKSPLLKSLKGDQYKLPQHLQEAIKAAPGKLKTPLKKGYFKNK